MRLDALERILDHAPAPIDLFVRNDDVGWEMDALDRLLGVLSELDCAVDLAVIPAVLTDDTARRLQHWRQCADIGLHQHGYAHINYEPEGRRKCEFGDARPAARQYADIKSGMDRLVSMLGPCDPIFTPPWNRCQPETADTLIALGFRILSQDASADPLRTNELALLPVDFDWNKAQRASDGHVAATLAERIDHHPTRIGLMLHHATLTNDDLKLVASIIATLKRSGIVRFRTMRSWLGD